MGGTVSNYQCPACTGPLHFSARSGKLECEYCGSSFSVEEMEARLARQNAEAEKKAAEEGRRSGQDAAPEGGAPSPGEGSRPPSAGAEEGGVPADGAGLRSCTCPSCGAELVCADDTLATSCPYCGNPSLIPGAFNGKFRPDCLIPFRLDKEAARKGLLEFYKGKRFLPDNFAEENHLDEIKGVYVPFWLYSGQADAWAEFHATRSRAFATARERVVQTEHYFVRRVGSMAFADVPADASTKMPDEYMDAVEPFDFSELRPYAHSFLPGFLASMYDQTAEEDKERVERRVAQTALEVLESDVTGYHSVGMEGHEVRIRYGNVRYALLPVWLLATKWNGETFLFAMNGQTGKFVGNLPVDSGKYWRTFLAIGAPLAALFCGLALFL